jgi:hypothetical protein
MLAMMFTLHLLTVCKAGSFWEVAAGWFDNPYYLEIVTIIRNWHAPNADIAQHFWGFPYAIAAVSKLFGLRGLMALVMISMLGSLVVCILVHRLYGGWVAAAFIFVNYEWIMLSVDGGSEPLFMCLLYASFLAVRSGRWNLATLLASVGTTVRPVGVFALLSFAVVLAMQRNYRRLAIIMLIGLAVGALYVVPLCILVGNPFVNFIGYRGCWGTHRWPLTYPLGGWISTYISALYGNTRWYMLVFFAIWPVVALAGTVAIWLPRNRERFSQYQPEALFASIYTLFFLSYTDGVLAASFTRFLIPVLPLLLFSLRDWIPRDRRVLWGGAVLSALLSSAALVHFKNVLGFMLP